MTIADVERRTTTEHATILWRVRRVAWHRFTRQYRRSLVITQGLVIAGVAIALPLYLQVVGYDVPGRESTLGRELPPHTKTALSWALWTTQLGTLPPRPSSPHSWVSVCSAKSAHLQSTGGAYPSPPSG